MKIHFYSLCIFLFLFARCAKPQKIFIPFDFGHPAEIIKLPESLHEISGICLYKKNELACIQDEKGIIFFYDLKKDILRKTILFGRDKDYEGITNVHGILFVLRSNGVISEVDSTKETGYANTYATFLSKENNCEGLCYDKKNNRLLIACKGRSKKGTTIRGMKAVYSFNLETRTMDRTPAYTIDPDSVYTYLFALPRENNDESFTWQKPSAEDFAFDPSEICIDPLTNDIYMLSSVGKTILAMTYDGQIKFALHLDQRIFKQPEGLTFSKDGTMYISDEGRNGKANLIKILRIPS